MFFRAEWSLGKANKLPCICICFYLYLYSFSVCISLFRFWKSEQVALARRDLSRVLRCPAWGFLLQTDTHILLSLYPGACQGIRSSRNKVGYIWQGVVWIRRKAAEIHLFVLVMKRWFLCMLGFSMIEWNQIRQKNAKGRKNARLYCGALQCTMCTLDSFFSFRPSALGLIVQPQACHVIEHIFVPTHSVERNIEKSRFPWASNSKFVIFPQIFPCSNYKLCPIIPL